MIQFDLVDQRATTPKQNGRIASLAEQRIFVTARDISKKLRKTGATVNERMSLEQSSSQMQLTFIKALVLTKVRRKNGLKIKQSYELETGDLFRQDNHSAKYSKRIGMKLARRKEDRGNCQVLDQVECSGLFFKS